MLTKADFQNAIRDSVDNYPAIAPLYRAGDPRILQPLDAIATMFALLSGQIETAMMEPFAKARDTTVYADAALRGIVPKATPARATIAVANKGETPYTVAVGRGLLDSSGRPWVTDTAATIASNATGYVEATQKRTDTISHGVTESAPWYAVEVPLADMNGSALAFISVMDSEGTEFEYRERFTNTSPGDQVYHVEVDEYQRLYVRFGWTGVVGYQPEAGDTFTLSVDYCDGAIDVPQGSPFAFDYLAVPAESALSLSFDSLLSPGQDAIPLDSLRDLARYPSTYDHSAVFLGEFDFLLRRHFPTAQFLSVWNEATEEQARGASVDNINTLFVAMVSSEGGETVLDEPDPEAPVAPTLIDSADLSGSQEQAMSRILAADNSYRVRFYTPVRSLVSVTVTADVPTAYDPTVTAAQIRAAVLAEYGPDTPAARHGRMTPQYRRLYALLEDVVPALRDRSSDWTLAISAAPEPVRPEHWRYVTDSSLNVTVRTVNAVPAAFS